MVMLYVKAALSVLVAVLAACTDVSQASGAMRAEAELQAAEARGLAASQTQGFERAQIVPAHLKQ
jgi:hypothetical protein